MAIDIEFFYKRYGPMVLRRCRELLRDEELAADAMHDVFLALLKKQESLTEDSPSSLLYTIATNLCLNKIRADKRAQHYIQEEGKRKLLMDIAMDDNMEKEVGIKSLLAGIFRRHPQSTKTIAVLHYVDGFTLNEVACKVGMSVSGIRKRLRAVRAHIKGLKDTNEY